MINDMLFSSKKAMSPLIATVLLIAFAVALGTMIMNWSSGIDETSPTIVPECDGISITTTNICYAKDALQLSLKNDGGGKIGAVSVRLLSEENDLDMTVRIKDSSIFPGENIKKSVPLINLGQSTTIEVTPMIVVDGELYSCEDAGFIQQNLINCK